ncbi:MAG: hypothetical protein RIE73_00290 [Coleofasciculus sp. C1-SOL-03]|uniref:hypothetical protein n=1 Tax=Coleofasciculus sp. C1-SOL-03 TaxID=3069522 RepID=UPI0032F63FE0
MYRLLPVLSWVGDLTVDQELKGLTQLIVSSLILRRFPAFSRLGTGRMRSQYEFALTL